MSARSVWRGLNELVEAKERAKEIERELEALQKRQRTLGRRDIEMHAQQLIGDVDTVIANIEEKFGGIIENLEAHKLRLGSRQEFIKRHYGRGGKLK